MNVDLFKFIAKHDLSNYTAIIPSVGVGNVGQLTVDLLIATLGMNKIATIWHPAIMPIIGTEAFDQDITEDNVTTSCELYICPKNKLIAFQLRSPLVGPLMEQFFNELIDTLKRENINQLIILTSSYAYEMHTVELTPFRFVASDQFKTENCERFKQLQWIAYTDDTIHGGGFANSLLDMAVKKSLKTLILFKYVSEGDNTPDARDLICYLNDFFQYLSADQNHDKIEFKVPFSWKFLYGNEVPENMY